MRYHIQIEKDEQGNFVGEIPQLTSCYSQAKNIPQLLERMTEVAEGSLMFVKDIQESQDPRQFSVSLNVQYAAA